MKNKKSLWWIVVIIALPFVIMFGLHIGIALGNYFHVNINVPNVDAASWFMFFGSYLGGVMTLVGVMITLRHERKIHQYEYSIDKIGKESEEIGKLICDINLLAPSTLYTQIVEMRAASPIVSASDLIELRVHITEEMHKVLIAKTELEFATDIYLMVKNCAACKTSCRIQEIAPKFIETYDLIGSKIYDTLSKMNNYILAIERNQACKSAGLEHQVVDLTAHQNEISTAIEEIAKFNQNEIQQLIGMGREYVEQKKQNAYKNCFPVKEVRK